MGEAAKAAQIKSDHVVTIYDVGEERDIPFIAMEYLQGSPLDDFLRDKGNIPIEHAIRIGREAAFGLVEVHAVGLVHRDIKPSNLWLEAPRGRVKIIDFGLARQEADDAHLTQSGTVLGTPAYMSPEQARAKKVDGRSDLFSLGGVLYRLCTGHIPFQGDTTMAILMSLGVDEPTPVRELNPQVPEGLAWVIHRLLTKNPGQRFQTAQEVADALGQLRNTGSGRLIPLAEPLEVSIQTQNVWAGIDDSSEDLTEHEPALAQAADQTGNSAHRNTKRPSGNPWLLIGGLLALVAVIGIILAVVFLQTPKGTLVVETAGDADVEVVVKQDGVVIRDKTRDREIELKVGNYTIELAEKKDGLRLNTDKFEITKNGKAVVKVILVKTKPKADPHFEDKDPDHRAAKYVLSIGGTVCLNDQPSAAAIKQTADLPRQAYRLTSVYLGGNKQLSDVGLANFKDCKNLTELDLAATGVSDAGLANFEDCKNLTSLNLYNTKVGDAGLAHFKDCKNLMTLVLSNTPVTDLGVAHFGECNRLTALNLSYTQVTDAGLANFKDCINLTSLDLWNTKVSDVGLAQLKDCKNLIGLALVGTQISNVGLAKFKDCKNLKNLRLGGPGVTDPGLTHFKNCKNLTYLDLRGAT